MFQNRLLFLRSTAALIVVGFAIPLFSQQVGRSSDSVFLPVSQIPTSQNFSSADCFAFTGDPISDHEICAETMGAVKKVTLTINIDRVVANTNSVNQDGSLQNVGQLIANGVVAPFMTLRITRDREATYAYGYSVAVNTHQVGTVPPSISGANDFHVDPSYLKFGVRQPGGNPTPGTNTITITMDGTPPPLPFNFTEHEWQLQASLKIVAMYPIVLVHGWNSGPWEWGPETPVPNGVCGAGQIGSDQGRATINALVTAGAPFDCSFRVDRQATIAQGAQTLLAGLVVNGRAVVPSVAQVAAQFGSRHVHIVTNSKGGLFTRAFLDLNSGLDPTSQTGVVSVTTLDTPHHGSVLSDTVVAYNSGVRSVVPGYLRVLMLFGSLFARERLRNAFGTGNKDMTVAEVEHFNSDHPYPPDHFQIQFPPDPSGHVTKLTIKNPFYYSTSGDADLNGDGQLQDNEAAPYIPVVARFQWNRVGRVAEITLGADSQGRTAATQITNAGFFAHNDTAVSIVSARYPPPSPVFTGFAEIKSYLANHASILCPQAGPQPLFCAAIPGPIVDVLASIPQAEQSLNEQIQ